MKLKNLVFPGYVFGQSGVQGFFGEGDEYPHHKFYKHIPGFSFRGMIFVAKTGTVEERIYPEKSNTALRDEYKLKDFFPSSVWCSIYSFWKGYLLNAIGLAGPGLEKLLKYYKWQNRSGDVFQISVMLMETGLQERLLEAQAICLLLKQYMSPKRYRYALQINFSCPNTGHEQAQDAENIIQILKVFRTLLPGLVLIPKFDLLVEPQTVSKIAAFCDAFCIANTVPFGKKENERWWKKLFKNNVSPLTKPLGEKFPGGLSGAPLFPLLVEWLTKMQQYDPSVTIIAGGGIMKKKDIKKLCEFNIVHGVALGSVAILRPWRLRGLIKYGNKIFSKKQKI